MEEDWQVVVQEDTTSQAPLHVRYPEARIVAMQNEHHHKPRVLVSSTPSLNKIHGCTIRLDDAKNKYNVSVHDGTRVKSGAVVLIVGPTGCGKSSLLHRVAHDEGVHDLSEPVWNPDRAVVSHFETPEDARKWLGCIGLNSIPSWCKPYHALSTGEKWRADLARKLSEAALSKGPVLVDGLGNHLDIDSAACCCTGLARALREAGLRAIVTTAKPEIASWLSPNLCLWLQHDTRPQLLESDGAQHPNICIKVQVPPSAVKQLRNPDDMWPDADSTAWWPSHSLKSPPLHLQVIKQETYVADSFEHDPSLEPKPRGGTVLVSDVQTDEATTMCDSLFDESFTGTCAHRIPDFPKKEDLGHFCLGLIVGPSGTSKSVLRREIYGPDAVQAVVWDKPIIAEHFDDLSRVKAMLSLVDLSEEVLSHHPDHLSTGERWQADVLRVLYSAGTSDIVIDEFASILDDRTAARVATGVGKFARDRKSCDSSVGFIVIVSCRSELISTLAPDWVYETAIRTCTWFESSAIASNEPPDVPVVVAPTMNPPRLCFSVRAAPVRLWQNFREHHYKSQTLSAAAHTFALVHDAPDGAVVGFLASIRHNGPRAGGVAPRRAHRTVILPSWQGLGLGSRLGDAIAELHRKAGAKYYGQTVHPTVGAYRDRSNLWSGTKFNHLEREYRIEGWRQRKEKKIVKLSISRFIYAHEYVGPPVDDPDALGKRGIRFEQVGCERSPDFSPETLSAESLPPSTGKNPFSDYMSWCHLQAGRALPRAEVIALWISLPKETKSAFVENFRKTRGFTNTV